MIARLIAAAGLLAVAASARAKCELSPVVSLPMEEIGGRVFIPRSIGEHRVDFLVDLATRTTLLEAAARHFGITPNNMRA